VERLNTPSEQYGRMVIDMVMLSLLFKLVLSILCELCIFPWSEVLFQPLLDL
jgi:hypothetical protein